MVWVIIIIVVIIIAFKIGSSSGKVIENVTSSGGMRMKYAKLLSHILEGHEDSQVFVETKTYIRAGVINYGGTTLFHIQQSVGHSVVIQYEVKNNPVCPAFQLQWTFDDNMDQDAMMIRMATDIERKSKEIMRM